MKRYYAAILFVLFIFTNSAFSAEKMRIAVMDFQGKGVSKATSDNVAELIRGEMINSGKFLVVERAQMDKILKEQGLQQSGCTDVSCAVEVGKVLSARKILVGTVMKLGGTLVITGRIVDVESSLGEFSEKQEADSEKDLVKAISEFTENLIERIEEGDDAGGAQSSLKSRYGGFSLAFSGAALLGIGGGFYFNTQVTDANSDFDSMKAQYEISPSVGLKSDMEAKNDDAETYALYRNISYGVGAASLLVSGYFLYKYVTTPEGQVAKQDREIHQFIPVFYAGCNNTTIKDKGRFYGAGLVYRF